jgi:hypothetical protein
MRETSAEKEKARWTYPTGFILAERTGLEPATPGVTGRYSNRLNYRSSLLLSPAGVGRFPLAASPYCFGAAFVLASPRGFEPLYSP